MEKHPVRNIKPEEYVAVKAEIMDDPQGVGYRDAGGQLKPAAEIAKLLTVAPLVPNPQPQGTVRKPDTEIAAILRQALPPALIATFADQAIVQLLDAIDSGAWEKVRAWGQIGEARGKITADQRAAIEAIIDGTASEAQMPDPNWRAEIPGDYPLKRVLGRPCGISAEEVEGILAL